MNKILFIFIIYFQDLPKKTWNGYVNTDLFTQLHPIHKSKYLLSTYYVLSIVKYYSKYKKQKNMFSGLESKETRVTQEKK